MVSMITILFLSTVICCTTLSPVLCCALADDSSGLDICNSAIDVDVDDDCRQRWQHQPGSNVDDDNEKRAASTFSGSRPNIVLILTDDMGYGDLSVYGNPVQEWGAIDDLAIEGVRFTNFYSADCICTPSRAAMMTGRVALRSGIVSNGRRVFQPTDTGGLPRWEVIIPEALKILGYKTGMSGKWHLGINRFNSSDGYHLPKHHGFDFVGYNMPMGDDWDCDETKRFMPDGPDPKLCFVYNDDRIVQQPIFHENLTRLFVDDFVQFLDENIVKPQKHEKPENPDITEIAEKKRNPFFFFLSLPHGHSPINVDSAFEGSSARAWAVEQVISKLRNESLDKNTLVLFTSDHGPAVSLCFAGGVSGGLKGYKAITYEGGYKVPTIAWWPGVIKPATSSSEILSALDFLPTFVDLAGGRVPTEVTLDGHVVTDHMLGIKPLKTGSKLEKQRPIFYYMDGSLSALRLGPYKFHYVTYDLAVLNSTNLICPFGWPIINWRGGKNTGKPKPPAEHNPPLVYDLNQDPFELYTLDPRDEKIKQKIKEADEIVKAHKQSIITMPRQMGNFSDAVQPCCNPPECRCKL